MAVIWCVPTPRAAVLRAARPPLRPTVPRTVPPSRNVTVPLGVAVPLAARTVAVKVTDWPAVGALVEAARLVSVAVRTGATVTVTADDELPPKPVAPP